MRGQIDNGGDHAAVDMVAIGSTAKLRPIRYPDHDSACSGIGGYRLGPKEGMKRRKRQFMLQLRHCIRPFDPRRTHEATALAGLKRIGVISSVPALTASARSRL